MAADLAWLDAHEQADLVRRGDATPIELVEAAIDRIERVNPQLNAVIHPRFEEARKEAAGDIPDGPFRGVPILLKDLGLYSKGDPYHAGTRVLRDAGYRADHDSALARRFREAGFVAVGRTNVPENGSTVTTEPLAYGPCRNPWNTDHSTGGSSGGSASAVAAGLVPVAHANDGGGSIRIPAGECGLVGLKPSRGRVTQAPDHGEQWMGGVVDGVVTRTVRDTAACLDLLSGYEPGDPYVAPSPARAFLAEVGADPGRLRVGLLDHPLTEGVTADADCATAVAAAGRVLSDLGHDVDESHPAALEEAEFSNHFMTVVGVANAVDFEHFAALVGRPLGDDDFEPRNALLRALGSGVSAVGYVQSVDWLHGWTRRMAEWWTAGFDILVTPILNTAPPPIGWLSDPAAEFERLTTVLQYTSQYNVSGQPAITVPVHWNAAGLPVAVQFVAAYGREDVLIRLASQIETAQPWKDRRPPVHA